jgi:hypothetical protein
LLRKAKGGKEEATKRLLKKEFSCFDGLSTNGKKSMISKVSPFALSQVEG